MTGDLDNILSGEELAPVEPAEVEKEEAQPERQEGQEETGEDEQAETPAAEVPPTPEPKEEKVPLAALMAERQKRKELEAKLNQQPPPQLPDFREAPELHIQAQVMSRIFAMSEAMAREMYQDYDEVVEEFIQYAQDNPVLQAELNASANPATFAYKKGKALREYREMQDVPALKAKIEAETKAEIEARIRAEMEAKYAAKQSVRESLPPDLTAARGTRTPEPVVNASLDSILKTKR